MYTLPLGEGLWKGISKLRSYRQDFLDVREGQAASHVIVEENGMPVMLALRLKIADKKISEIETMVTRNRTEGAIFNVEALQTPKAEMNKDITANNIAYVTADPLYAFTRFFHSNQAAPVGVNWSCYANPEVDKLINEALATFDPTGQDALIAKVHEKVVDDAVLIWVVHDTNPHALSPRIKSYVQAQHWFQDLTTIGV